jgi:hypothetical protein
MGADSIPAPCDKGTYSTGGTEAAPNATCTACATGFSTHEDESTSDAECAVCAPGYGGAGCAQCGYGFFASGGGKVGDDCAACATGSTSRKGATQSQQCYSTLIDARNDVFNLADENAWVENAATTGATCGSACTDLDTCVMYRFVVNEAGDGSGKCSLLSEAATPTHTVGFKIGKGDYYSVWGLWVLLLRASLAVSLMRLAARLLALLHLSVRCMCGRRAARHVPSPSPSLRRQPSACSRSGVPSCIPTCTLDWCAADAVVVVQHRNVQLWLV